MRWTLSPTSSTSTFTSCVAEISLPPVTLGDHPPLPIGILDIVRLVPVRPSIFRAMLRPFVGSSDVILYKPHAQTHWSPPGMCRSPFRVVKRSPTLTCRWPGQCTGISDPVTSSSHAVSPLVEHGDHVTHGYSQLPCYLWTLGLEDKEERS